MFKKKKVKIMLFYYTMKLNRVRLHSESQSESFVPSESLKSKQLPTASPRCFCKAGASRLECRFPRLSGSKKGAYSFKENWCTPIRNQIKPLTMPQHRAAHPDSVGRELLCGYADVFGVL